MKWNWQQLEWPHFSYNEKVLAGFETRFQHQSGVLLGATKHIDNEQLSDLTISLMSTEAIKTSEIEGEILNRDSVQSSIKKNFGLSTGQRRIAPAEEGIAEMMMDVHQNYEAPLTHDTLFQWHDMIMRGRVDLKEKGCYRTHEDAMQIISGADYAPKIHFEAPPSKIILPEMNRFIRWFNSSLSLLPLTRAGVAHYYFENIHPFEDGNGRIGRILVEKSLSQSLRKPVLITLSQTIESQKKAYYRHLGLFNKRLEITGWLSYFSEIILEAQQKSLSLIDFLIYKARLYDRLRGCLNERQEKALARMFKEGPDGFKGGMSAEKYIKITNTTRPTATRDLSDLVKKGALTKTGERRYTRYWLLGQNKFQSGSFCTTPRKGAFQF